MEWYAAVHLVSLVGFVLLPFFALALSLVLAVASATAILYRLGKKKKP